eukprot:gene19478-biopygen23491
MGWAICASLCLRFWLRNCVNFPRAGARLSGPQLVPGMVGMPVAAAAAASKRLYWTDVHVSGGSKAPDLLWAQRTPRLCREKVAVHVDIKSCFGVW